MLMRELRRVQLRGVRVGEKLRVCTGLRPPAPLHLWLLRQTGVTSRSTVLLHPLRRISTVRAFPFPCLLSCRVPCLPLTCPSPHRYPSRLAVVFHMPPRLLPPLSTPVSLSIMSRWTPFKVKEKPIALEPKSLPVITGFSPEPSQCLTESLRHVITHLLKRCQRVTMTIESGDWIPGWLDPPRPTLQATVIKPLAKHPPLMHGFLAEADEAVERGIRSREVFLPH